MKVLLGAFSIYCEKYREILWTTLVWLCSPVELRNINKFIVCELNGKFNRTLNIFVGERKRDNHESEIECKHTKTHSWNRNISQNDAILGFPYKYFLPFVIFQLKARIEKKTSISIQKRRVIEQTIPTLVTGTGFPKITEYSNHGNGNLKK